MRALIKRPRKGGQAGQPGLGIVAVCHPVLVLQEPGHLAKGAFAVGEHIGCKIAAGAAETEARFVHHAARQIIFNHVAIEPASRGKGVGRDGAQPIKLAAGAGQIGSAAGAAVIGKLRFQAGIGARIQPQRCGAFW